MEALKYKIIKTLSQYKNYCSVLEGLVNMKRKSKATEETIELLTLLIEKWDADHNTFSDADPVELLVYLMKQNKMKAIDLSVELSVSKSLVSDILHYRRGLSRDIIRKLSARFKVSQESFNKSYKLVPPVNSHLKETRVINNRKKLSKAV
jgi:HTH-type transcriptional regulator / antitoxin HigA